MIHAFTRRTLGLIGTTLTLCASAQQLANTTWAVFDQGVFSTFMRFNGSVLAYSPDNVSYTDVSNYTDNSGNFTIEDIGVSCTGITGTYTYIVDGDTLRWALVSDTCPTRSDFFVLLDWASIPTGITGSNDPNPMVVFPNPAQREIRVSGQDLSGQPYTLHDGLGKVVSSGRLEKTEATIDLADLGPGTYILRVGSGAWAPMRITKL